MPSELTISVAASESNTPSSYAQAQKLTHAALKITSGKLFAAKAAEAFSIN